jgi:hypothetical protein
LWERLLNQGNKRGEYYFSDFLIVGNIHFSLALHSFSDFCYLQLQILTIMGDKPMHDELFQKFFATKEERNAAVLKYILPEADDAETWENTNKTEG